MTDQELEQRLRSWYRAQISDAVRAPIELRTSVAAIAPARQGKWRMPWALSNLDPLTRFATAALIALLAVGGLFFLLQRPHMGVGSPSSTPRVTPSADLIGGTPTPNPATATSLPGPLGTGRQIQTATLLGDGHVLVAGGYGTEDRALASAVLYDVAADVFSPTASLADPRGYHTATLLSDGRVLVAGGGPPGWPGSFSGITGPFLASAEIFDPGTETFSPTGSMATPREVHTATRLADGRVLIVGGADFQSRAVASAEIFDPRSGTFSPTGSMMTPRAFHTATLLADGRVLIAGGSPAAWGTTDKLASAETYDPRSGTFTATGSMAGGRDFHTATLLDDGRVLITGGDTPSEDGTASAEIYDPTTGTFTATGSMTVGRDYHTATVLADRRVLIVGGGNDYANRKFLASAEIYDPTTGTFTATGSMVDARTYHAATLLADGRVLVTGGYGAVAPLASAEIFDPTKGTFTLAGPGG